MKKIFILFALVFLSGCASMFSGTKETILVRSEEKDSNIYLNNEYIGRDSAIAIISKKKLKNSTIRVEKKGCEPTNKKIETKFDATTLLGCFLDFCIVSVLVVDGMLTGAINEATQTNYFVTPVCSK